MAKKTDIHNGALLEQFGMKPYKLRAKESYMTKRQLTHFRKLLNAWMVILEKDVQKV